MAEPNTPHLDTVRPIVEKYGKDPSSLFQMLVDIQEQLHCVPEPVVEFLAAELQLTPLRIKGVISFYSFLSTEYQGEYLILLADNIIEQMQGNRDLGNRLCSRLNVRLGKLRKDKRVKVDYTSCIGMGDQGPAALVNGRIVTRLNQERIDRIAELVEARTPMEKWPQEFFEVTNPVWRSDTVFRRQQEPGAGLKSMLARVGKLKQLDEDELDPREVAQKHREHVATKMLEELSRSGLRGRGGAFFKTSIKWESCKNAKAQAKYILCNADEGEPGTFKDRYFLMEKTDLVFEGMTIAGYTVGAAEGVLYIRGEYRFMKEHLESVLRKRREAGLLGKNILDSGFDFDIKIHWGGGAYICGMETALIESLEGKRGVPRRRFPLCVEWGYRGMPTVVNNVESYACASMIAEKGGDWFARLGTEGTAGTKLFCISGDCVRPGLREYPFGVTLREILRDCGAQDAQALQTGGPSGTLIHPSEFDRMVSWEDLLCVGTIMVIGPKRDLFEVLYNFTKFFQHESCGLCTPCRVGTTLLVNMMNKFKAGFGSPVDIAEIKLIASAMKQGAHCGLGQTASNHLVDAVTKFLPVFESHMKTKEFVPAFDLDGALEEARQLTGRTDAGAFIHDHEHSLAH